MARHPDPLALVALLALLSPLVPVAGCAAPVTEGGPPGDRGEFTLPGADGKSDAEATIYQAGFVDAAPFDAPRDVVSGEFSSDGYRFHSWKTRWMPKIAHVEIDTHGTFEPVFLVYTPVVDAHTDSRQSMRTTPFWIEPTPDPARPGVYSFHAIPRWDSIDEPSMTLLVTSREAAEDSDVQPAEGARYDLQFVPVPEYGAEAHTVGCIEDCAVGDDEPREVTFYGDAITLDLDFEGGAFVNRVSFQFSEKAHVIGASYVTSDGVETEVNYFDLQHSDGYHNGQIFVARTVSHLRLRVETDDTVFGDFVIEDLVANGMATADLERLSVFDMARLPADPDAQPAD